jgi:hypothetical protein
MSLFLTAMKSKVPNEKGAMAYRDAEDPLVGLFFKLVRDLPDYELDAQMRAVLRTPEAMADLVVLAFQTRGTRGIGKGEKALFYKMLARLPVEAVLATLPLVPHFGYYKDFLLMQEVKGIAPEIKQKALEIMTQRLRKDADEVQAALKESRVPTVSLAGKYAPREGGHFSFLAKALSKMMFPGSDAPNKQYRQLVVKLNEQLQTVEVMMSANRFAEIEFTRVSSLCLQRSRKAFLNEALKGKLAPHQEDTGNRRPEDEGRVTARNNLRSAMEKKDVINGAQLMPHEIVGKLLSPHARMYILNPKDKRRYAYTFELSAAEKQLMDAQWSSILDSVQKSLQRAAEARAVGDAPVKGKNAAIDLGKLIPLIDTSGSMHGEPLAVAIALGIIAAQLTHPAFRNHAITFESTPKLVELPDGKIVDIVRAVEGMSWGGSTNFEAACELILSCAREHKLAADEIPDLLVLSDMQFDQANNYNNNGYSTGTANPWETHHERLTRRFAEVGIEICGEPYRAPRIIYWNLRGNTPGFPTQANAPNTQMLSGFSPALFKLVLSCSELGGGDKSSGPTPHETVRAALDNKDFFVVREALAGIADGIFKDYKFEPPKDETMATEDDVVELEPTDAPPTKAAKTAKSTASEAAASESGVRKRIKHVNIDNDLSKK